MKRVFFTRHGKSSWDNLYLDDHSRSLKDRGRKDARLIAGHLKDIAPIPEVIYSSSAVRAKETAEIFQEVLGIPFIQFFRDLYHAGPIRILEFLGHIEVDYSTVMLFGHNPGYTELINRYSMDFIDNVPTSATFLIDFDTDDWSEIQNCRSTLAGFWRPKDFKT
jgi:phosphohistidine phosphatase